MMIIVYSQAKDQGIATKIPLCQLLISQKPFQSVGSIFNKKPGITSDPADCHLAVAGTNQHAFVLCNRTLAIFQPSGEKIIIRAEAVSGAHRQINAVSLYKSRHHSGRKPGI